MKQSKLLILFSVLTLLFFAGCTSNNNIQEDKTIINDDTNLNQTESDINLEKVDVDSDLEDVDALLEELNDIDSIDNEEFDLSLE